VSDIQDDLKKLRTLIQKMGWGEFMSHVGSLLAEQADKTDGDQSGALSTDSESFRKEWSPRD
jgi:hypothetical protein